MFSQKLDTFSAVSHGTSSPNPRALWLIMDLLTGGQAQTWKVTSHGGVEVKFWTPGLGAVRWGTLRSLLGRILEDGGCQRDGPPFSG